jgi:putative membrane protein insertion efficiency factor
MKTVLIKLIEFYRKGISPYKMPCCRFTPTCSEYAVEAIGKFGVIRGILLATYRILRCNPFCRGGYDPVPERFTFKRQSYEKIEEQKND